VTPESAIERLEKIEKKTPRQWGALSNQRATGHQIVLYPIDAGWPDGVIAFRNAAPALIAVARAAAAISAKAETFQPLATDWAVLDAALASLAAAVEAGA